MVKISVIMPTFNCAAFIAEALSSVQTQDFQDWELIVVDDGSTDATEKMIGSIDEPRLRYLRNDANAGPSASRNRGIAEARGEWFALLDADDRFEQGRLGRLLSQATENGADIIADDVVLWNPDSPKSATLFEMSGGKLSSARMANPEDFLTMNLVGRRTETPGWIKPVFSRDFVRRNNLYFDPAIRMSEDYLFYCACLASGAKMLLVPEAGYFYRQREGSTSKMALSAWADSQVALRDRLIQIEYVRARPMLMEFNENERREMLFARQYWRVREAFAGKQFSIAATQLLGSPLFAACFFARRAKEFVSRRYALIRQQLRPVEKVR